MLLIESKAKKRVRKGDNEQQINPSLIESTKNQKYNQLRAPATT